MKGLNGWRGGGGEQGALIDGGGYGQMMATQLRQYSTALVHVSGNMGRWRLYLVGLSGKGGGCIGNFTG